MLVKKSDLTVNEFKLINIANPSNPIQVFMEQTLQGQVLSGVIETTPLTKRLIDL